MARDIGAYIGLLGYYINERFFMEIKALILIMVNVIDIILIYLYVIT